MQLMYKKILVTGGSAVAGDGLKSVVAKGECPGREFLFPSSKELNLLSFDATKAYLETHKPDAIIDFAALAGGLKLTMEHPASVMRDNIAMNFNLAEASRLTNKPKIVMTLSAAIYPLNTPVPMKEEAMHLGYPHESNYSYAFAKRLIEPMARAYKKEYNQSIVGIIPGAIIGPRSNFNPEASTAVPGMIRRFFEKRATQEPLVIWGDGSPIRQFTSDEDVARIAMWFLDNYDDPQPLNISTSEETSIKEAAHLIAEFMGLDPSRLTFDDSKPKGVHSQSVDNSKFTKLSGFVYAPARETFKRTVEYFVEHYPNKEKLRL